VIDQITKMAKKGMTPSQIGVMLRDSHGIAQVKAVTGSKILRILKSQGMFAVENCFFPGCALHAHGSKLQSNRCLVRAPGMCKRSLG
jgi:hypothetical protein